MVEIDKKVDFFKYYYEKEEKRKEQINQQLFYYITLISLQITWLGYYFLNLPPFKQNCLLCIFLLLILISIILLLIVGYYIYLYMKNGKYYYMPYPNELSGYIDQLDSSDEFKKTLCEYYVDASQKNVSTNDSRQAFIIKIRNLLSINIIVLSLAFVPYFILCGEYINTYKVVILK